MKMSASFKVGILSILSLCILVLGVMWLKGRSISIGEKIEVHFKDIDGMRPGSAVQMMGMRIGQVDEIEPVINGENSFIIVRFVINELGVKIPPASKISIQQSGIIGEKFLEITPPFPQTVLIPLEENFKGKIPKGSKTELLAGGRYINIGEVKHSKIIDVRSLPIEKRRYLNTAKAYKIEYFITIPEVKVPMYSSAELIKVNKKGDYALRLTPPENVVVRMPEYASQYTIEEPMRMKVFLDIQMEAAQALKETNDKINELFTEEFMGDIRYTFENTRDLSEKASYIVDQVAVIVESSKEDIEILISSAAQLTENMTVLSANVNEIVEDPQFKESIIATADSIKVTSEHFSTLIAESKIQDSLLNINATTEDFSEVAEYVNNLTKNKEFNAQMGETVGNLNDMMVKLTRIIDSVDELTVEEKSKIKELINNSTEASRDLNKFSKKLNKRFLLLRLMF